MPKRKRKEEDGSKNEVKYQGVYKNGERFRASISIDRKKQGLGTFDTTKEAAEAHDRAAIQAGCPISTLNFLDQVPKFYKPKKTKLRSSNTTGYRGVTKKGNKFKGQIQIDGRRHHIGYFGTAKEAAIAFDFAAIKSKRPKSELNFTFLHDCLSCGWNYSKNKSQKEEELYEMNEQDRFQWSIQETTEVSIQSKY